MSNPLFDRLERQLSAAMAVHVPVVKRRWWASRGALLGGGAAVLVGGVAVAAQPWNPTLGHTEVDAPTTATTPVPAEASAAMAVLRRPQTAADRGPDVQPVLRFLVRVEDHGIRLDGVRRLAGSASSNAAVVLIPKEAFGEDGSSATRPQTRDALCVAYPNFSANGTRSVANGCWTIAQIKAGKAVGLALSGDRFHLQGLVPDGVTAVRAHRTDGTISTASVTSNFFDIPGPEPDTPTPTPRGATASSLDWLDAAGNVLRTFGEP